MIAVIQALRAFAVMLVVLGHVFPAWLPGGYIGVDVFFVISGFLILGQVIERIEAKQFSLTEFYLRRARRLLPAALVVLLAVTAATAVLMPRAWSEDTFREIALSAVYAVNWWLAHNAANYFSDSDTRSPVIHFWSLAAEEQFYIISPLALVSFHFIFLKRCKDLMSTRCAIAIALGLVAVISFAVATYQLKETPTETYFYAHARAWEFAIGGLAWLASRSQLYAGIERFSKLTIGAWILLLASSWILGPHSAVPGTDSVPVVLATAFILIIGDAHKVAALGRFFDSRTVRGLGAISYSLYLWHLPILVLLTFTRLNSLPEGLRGLLGICIAIPLATFTYHQVEVRFRQNRVDHARTLTPLMYYLLASLGVAACSWGLATNTHNRALAIADELYHLSLTPTQCFGGRARETSATCPNEGRLANPDFALQSWQTMTMHFDNGWPCQVEQGDSNVRDCAFGAADGVATQHVALFGDSHAGMWASALSMFALRDGLRVHTFIASSCTGTDSKESFASWLPPDMRGACLSWRERVASQLIASERINLVIVSGAVYELPQFASAASKDDDGEGFASLWQRLAASGKHVLVIDDIPPLKQSPPLCLTMAGEDSLDPCQRKDVELPHETAFGRAIQITRSGPFAQSIHWLSYRDTFCRNGLCSGVIGGIPAYVDRDHISAPMARSLAEPLRDMIQNVLPSH